MKRIYYFTIALSALFILQSCDQDLPENEAITIASEGGALSVGSSLGYVVGSEGPTTSRASFIQGDVKTTKVEVYKSFESPTDTTKSDEILFRTFDISEQGEGAQVVIDLPFDYQDLAEGLTLDKGSLPDEDSGLNIGDFWTLRYVSTTSNGTIVENSVSTKVSVSTRFAGKYAVNTGVYYRIGVLRDDVAFPDEMTIESVDATTYRIVDYFGAFEGNELFFQIDADGIITYPENKPNGDAQVGNGEPLITCTSSPNNMTNVPCGASESNFVQQDDVNGEDVLFMTFGYLTAGSGPREFYQVLEKIVD
ncbi:hypothetical protein [Pseudozobellia sp. WGM2]|uniref:hypothetical protein n=1 Tax=Pseudozobellia sp. WGM2 TaxID=2787625 RepID=UPI001AE02FA5|nr:hypothetical protein [Pseudozobellia sp. WGM2]